MFSRRTFFGLFAAPIPLSIAYGRVKMKPNVVAYWDFRPTHARQVRVRGDWASPSTWVSHEPLGDPEV